MRLCQRISEVRLTRADSAHTPASPISLRPNQVAEVDEVGQRPSTLIADMIVPKIKLAEVDEV